MHPRIVLLRPRARLRHRTAALLGASLLLPAAAAIAGAPDADPAAPGAGAPDPAVAGADAPSDDVGGEILVTARNRTENAQKVPIPISVVGGERLDRERIFTVADLAQRAPGLTVTSPNARRSGISIRGIGKTSGNDNMEAAVGVIVDDVFLGHVGMTYQDFTDLERVEVLRGPQGTLLGKNTSLGVIKYTSKAPSFTPEGLVELEGGIHRAAYKARASFSDGLVDKIAYRASFFYDKQAGDILNVNPVGGRWHERNRWGGRVQLLFKPTERLSFRLNADAAKTHENSNTKPFMIDPTTLNDGSVRTTTYTTRLARSYFGGYRPIIGSWSTIDMDQAEPLITKNSGVSLVSTWDAGPFEITSITAYRWFHFDAKNDSEQTGFAIARSGTLVDTHQFSQEVRIAGRLSPRFDYQIGAYFFSINTDTASRNLYGKDAGAFYATDAQYRTLNTTAGTALLQSSLANVYNINVQNPISHSQTVFGQANWSVTDRATLTFGARYTHEHKTNNIFRKSSFFDGSPLVATGNTTADAIRAAQLGTDYTTIEGDPINDGAVAWLINPSYKLSDAVLLYASASKGQKSGAVAFDSNGTRRNVKPERATDYELGVKTSLFDRRLILNANLYYTKVRDYQNTTSEIDPTSSTGYSSRLGNIPGIKARGIEFDAVVDFHGGLTFNIGSAYNRATYSDWSTATCPRSYPSTVLFCDNTGRQIVGAPKWTLITGFNYVHVIPGTSASVHLFGNNAWRSKHNLEQLLSPYGLQKAYSITDAGIGLIKKIRGVDTEFNIVANNLFDKKYTTSVNDFSNTSPVGYDGIGPRRYIGAQLRARF